jgi:uncharacterized membrane protein
MVEAILEKVTKFIFGLICHQDPSVLMQVNGKDIYLCPRCIGLHLGFLISFVIMALSFKERIRIADMKSRIMLAVAIGSIGLDWGLGSYFGLYTPTHISRLITGLACGSALSVLFIYYRRDLTLPYNTQTVDATGGKIGGIICATVVVGSAIVAFSNWAALSLVLLLTVAANVLLIVHSFILMVRTRFFKKPCFVA